MDVEKRELLLKHGYFPVHPDYWIGKFEYQSEEDRTKHTWARWNTSEPSVMPYTEEYLDGHDINELNHGFQRCQITQ